ncbi:MAG: hypothetical protein LH473_00930 [Chitinophagales bacterium]|nr:hypothetical protein [Chitinophagales bacterium]
MSMVFVTAIYMSIAHNIPFLFMVGIFSYQMVVTGRRTVYNKNPSESKPIAKLDQFILIASLISDFVLVTFGLYRIFMLNDFFGAVAIVFGAIGLQLVYTS